MVLRVVTWKDNWGAARGGGSIGVEVCVVGLVLSYCHTDRTVLPDLGISLFPNCIPNSPHPPLFFLCLLLPYILLNFLTVGSHCLLLSLGPVWVLFSTTVCCFQILNDTINLFGINETLFFSFFFFQNYNILSF